MATEPQTNTEDTDSVISPFSNSAATLGRDRKRHWPLIAVGTLAFFVLALIGGVAAWQYFSDPFRTLQPFPATAFFENHRSLEGNIFKSDLRVQADLGFKEGKGRLMVFEPAGSSRFIVAHLPPELAETYFVKGQQYLAELQVKEGGLIEILRIRKN